MNRELKTIFIIPDDLCRRAGITATWLPINELSIYAYQKRKIIYQKDEPSHFTSNTPSSVFHLRQKVILFHPILRKLVNECNSVFLTLQNLRTDKVIDHKFELLKLSRQYRSVIRACLENLQEEIHKSKLEDNDELHSYVTILYSVECIWHLTEILFVDVIPGNMVLPHLMEWVRFHFPKYERNAAAMLGGDLDGLESHPKFWETVLGLLLQGRINIVRALLRQHSAADSKTFKSADQLLRIMPIYDIASGTPL
ncbi:hypothetical protein NQ317_012821 [Molorchus minor]|uniref:Nuclear pore complex protein Nup85 n=1 Tax=Molorchus minor TaxID=1323400 RepID=A0ABQ9K4T4_9CUCU|nr:hypothetical protein NQ317_012821 [Molorchus minor]